MDRKANMQKGRFTALFNNQGDFDQMSGDILIIVMIWGMNVATRTSRGSNVHRTVSLRKNYSVQNFNSAEVEKS